MPIVTVPLRSFDLKAVRRWSWDNYTIFENEMASAPGKVFTISDPEEIASYLRNKVFEPGFGFNSRVVYDPTYGSQIEIYIANDDGSIEALPGEVRVGVISDEQHGELTATYLGSAMHTIVDAFTDGFMDFPYRELIYGLEPGYGEMYGASMQT